MLLFLMSENTASLYSAYKTWQPDLSRVQIRDQHITLILGQRYWLPIKHRIDYKINLLTFLAIHGKAPVYIRELVPQFRPVRPLRSLNMGVLLDVPRSSTKSFGDRTFAYAAPHLWNKLAESLHVITDLTQFKKDLKTHLYTQAFN